MSAKIHPYLLARLVAVQEAFSQPGFRPVLATTNAGATSAAPKAQGNNWKELLKEEEEESGEGGGRGTMRGHRGKNAENAKAAMRKLTRNR